MRLVVSRYVSGFGSSNPQIGKSSAQDIKDVDVAWPIGLPLVRSLGGGLWEVRSNLTQRKIARVLFCIRQDNMILLHAFIKKTQKTPKQDLDLALARMNGDT